METKSDVENADYVADPVQRYDNKVAEMNSMGLIAALLFGFSVSLWIEFDEQLLADKLVLAFIFSIASITTVASSALATVIAITMMVSLRRLQFKFGKETNAQSLRVFKRETHGLRHSVRYAVFVAYAGFFVALMVYSHAKWMNTNHGAALWVLLYILLFVGLVLMLVVTLRIRSAYHRALEEKSNA
mmetsp:Transcript_92/g.140  ORF Transcript_92/g.140 Transcript_92/m.140 type:complete len:187 (+) Transcript_92:27-587(+)